MDIQSYSAYTQDRIVPGVCYWLDIILEVFQEFTRTPMVIYLRRMSPHQDTNLLFRSAGFNVT